MASKAPTVVGHWYRTFDEISIKCKCGKGDFFIIAKDFYRKQTQGETSKNLLSQRERIAVDKCAPIRDLLKAEEDAASTVARVFESLAEEEEYENDPDIEADTDDEFEMVLFGWARGVKGSTVIEMVDFFKESAETEKSTGVGGWSFRWMLDLLYSWEEGRNNVEKLERESMKWVDDFMVNGIFKKYKNNPDLNRQDVKDIRAWPLGDLK